MRLQKAQRQISKIQEGVATTTKPSNHLKKKLPEGGRKLPDDVANAVLPTTLVENINKEIEKMQPKTNIIT